MDLQESINRFAYPLTGLLLSWGVPAADASELAQDTLADAHLNLATFRGNAHDPKEYGRWLRGIARNKFRSWSRGRSRRERLTAFTSPTALDEVAAETVREDERLVQLRAEIFKLPSKQREVIVMFYLDETSIGDIAALLSVSAKAVEGRLYQARMTLRRRMGGPSNSMDVAKALLL